MPDTPAAPARRFPLGKVLAFAVLLPLLLFFLYTTFVLNWSYSEGERAGTLLKFSKKGWLCKTWEGEIAMAMVAGGGVPGDNSGISTNIWRFTVRDESILPAMNAALGRKVVLHYTEHKGIPTSCFGETPYFVKAVRVADDE